MDDTYGTAKDFAADDASARSSAAGTRHVKQDDLYGTLTGGTQTTHVIDGRPC